MAKNDLEVVEVVEEDGTVMPEETAISVVSEQETEDNKYLVKFRKPFVWEDVTYTEIDLSGFEDMSAKDMIQTQRIMEKSGSVNVLAEMSMEYACIFASKATKMPVEFFQALPPKEAIRIKNKVTNFFYGED